MNEQGQAIDRSGQKPLWLGVAALLCGILFAPVGLFLGIAAIATGVKARRAAAGRAVPGVKPGLVMGGLGVLLAVAQLASTIYMWNELEGFEKCQTTANTVTDEQQCRDQWFPKIDEKLGVPKGTFEGWYPF